MKISKSQLKQIIQEELAQVMEEEGDVPDKYSKEYSADKAAQIKKMKDPEQTSAWDRLKFNVRTLGGALLEDESE